MQVRFDASGPLTAELKEKVHAFVAAQDPWRIKRRMYLKTAVILTWAVLSYVALVFWSADNGWAAFGLSTCLGLALAGVGFGIQHDANHGAYPAGRGVRRALGFCLDLMGGSSYIWKFQHNINHHSFTNINDADADIDIGKIARLSPAQEYRSHFRYQHLYVWPLYSLLAASWVVYADWRDFFSSSIGSNKFPTPRGSERVLFWLGKVAWVVIWLVIPLQFHHVGSWLLLLLWAYLVLGFTLSIVFQLAHIAEEAEFPAWEGSPAHADRDFFTHQLATTVNFATSNRFLTWYLGGLNFQIEHHLFPKVPHILYPELAPIVEQTCKKHGAPYFNHPTFRAALGSHARWLYRMGRPATAMAAVPQPVKQS